VTRSAALLVHVGLSSGRWLLPWIGVLLVSISLAYAVNTAVVAGSTNEALATTASVGPASANADRCAVHGWTCLERTQ
jgi:hypothetical protein